MKDVLVDMVRQAAPLFDAVRVTGTDSGTKVEAYTEDKSLFLIGNLKEAIPECSGEFGIGSLTMLNGLLTFASYKADDAQFLVHRLQRDDLDFVSEFQFKDSKGAGTRFKTMSPRSVGEQATIKNIDWELTMAPSKAKIEEIAKLGNLMGDIGKMFGLRVENGSLFLTFGGNNEVQHNSTISLIDDCEIDGKLINSSAWYYSTPQLLAILKNANNAETSVRFSSRGVIGVVVNTEKGEYVFYLRGKPE